MLFFPFFFSFLLWKSKKKLTDKKDFSAWIKPLVAFAGLYVIYKLDSGYAARHEGRSPINSILNAFRTPAEEVQKRNKLLYESAVQAAKDRAIMKSAKGPTIHRLGFPEYAI